MGIIGVILLVVFVIICLLIIALVLVQNEDGDGLGGLLSGGSNSAFGSRSANVLTRATYVVVTLFFVSAFFLAFINKSPSDKGIEAAARQAQIESSDTEWFLEESAEDASVETGTAPADAASAE
ncbi:preprotein translocase subunit SecG [Treponema zuelzerae]|uniref:Protein-export membrane protein SecG n=1 Tax=Teretinema zuelzerae TaxID=156 RepID=A0AAE3EF91_9SPIR|nr:preprotein translocase subunit SecG [Teretinema zuelzerae]MCD1653327.1 preprotein translocase subunit SecG [Teretinema zuelzerae]